VKDTLFIPHASDQALVSALENPLSRVSFFGQIASRISVLNIAVLCFFFFFFFAGGRWQSLGQRKISEKQRNQKGFPFKGSKKETEPLEGLSVIGPSWPYRGLSFVIPGAITFFFPGLSTTLRCPQFVLSASMEIPRLSTYFLGGLFFFWGPLPFF